MNEDFKAMVLFAIESGETGPLLDWMEEHEHPKTTELRNYIAEAKTVICLRTHVRNCHGCQDKLRRLIDEPNPA